MSDRSEPDGLFDPSLNAIMSERRQLINLAYRLLGSLADAEDAAQETYARWYAMSRPEQDAIESPGAWLTTVASRICFNMLGSARARRETYVGEWIPEPVPDQTEWIGGRPNATTVDPADRITLDESINMAFLVVLDSMTPAERVAFILHDVFRYPFTDVADIVGRTPAACRQLATSARRRIDASRAPAMPSTQQATSSGSSRQPGKPRTSKPDRAAGPGRHCGRRRWWPRHRRTAPGLGQRADRDRLHPGGRRSTRT